MASGRKIQVGMGCRGFSLGYAAHGVVELVAVRHRGERTRRMGLVSGVPCCVGPNNLLAPLLLFGWLLDRAQRCGRI